MADEEDLCLGDKNPVDNIGLRIGAIFIIWISSLVFTLLPILTKRLPRLTIPSYMYDFARYFGSGVIIATGFVHLLDPALEELGHACLRQSFQDYPMAYCFMFLSMMLIFVGEWFAYRLGSAYIDRKFNNGNYSLRGNALHHHAMGHDSAHRENPTIESDAIRADGDDLSVLAPHEKVDAVRDEENIDKSTAIAGASSEVIGVFILEFGIIFHSVIIGLTLATSPYRGEPGEDSDGTFVVLFPVIVFHQLFEGLGLGSRLAFMPASIGTFIPSLLALAYSIVTPVGMAIGLGLRNTYTQDTPTGYYVTGVFDSLSAGILIYTGMVELLAHDFIFSDKMKKAPLWKVALNMLEVWVGVAVMALLGRWA